jgi:hypothetical protein
VVHEREFTPTLRSVPGDVATAVGRYRYLVPALITLLLITIAIAWGFWRAPGNRPSREVETIAASAIQQVRAGDLDIVLTSPSGQLRQGRSAFVIEFRSASTGELVDVGTVRASAAMKMPGMVMSGGVQATPSATPGRYEAVGEFGMAGAWEMTIEWQGPAGNGSVSFEGAVQ